MQEVRLQAIGKMYGGQLANMEDETITYAITCEICDVRSKITVDEIDEKPSFCPMCGEEVDFE